MNRHTPEDQIKYTFKFNRIIEKISSYFQDSNQTHTTKTIINRIISAYIEEYLLFLVDEYLSVLLEGSYLSSLYSA